jgi:hypothetical protein
MKILISFELLILSFMTHAKSFGPITALDGKAFIVNEFGFSRVAKRGDTLEVGDQIRVDAKSNLQFSDFRGRRFDIASRGHIKIGKEAIVLEEGYLRIKSTHPKVFKFVVKTSNGKVSFTTGEAILSYDSALAQTELLCLDGLFELENIFIPHSKIQIKQGYFSSIFSNKLQGNPTRPKKIGDISLELASAHFFAWKDRTRQIASSVRPGTIIFLPRTQKVKPVKKDSRLGPIKVHVFGRVKQKD